ncbi:MAG: tetratricopeptide repeat protein [Aristaeellaceae bacterium]
MKGCTVTGLPTGTQPITLEEQRMFCEKCGTPLMLTYSTRAGWQHTCVKCGHTTEADTPEHISREAGQAAQIGYSDYLNQHFTRAEQHYQAAWDCCPNAAEYLWALLLARYGIRYSPDPVCRGTELDYTPNYWKDDLPSEPLGKTKAYQQLCDLAGGRDPQWRTYYQKQCDTLDSAFQQIRDLQRAGQDFDIFLCFKSEISKPPQYTPEHELLEMVYPILTGHHLRVFYSPSTMNGQPVTYHYGGMIYHALRTARLLVVVASSPENAASPWVQSEWMRYRNWNTTQQERIITATIGSMRPAQFPQQLKMMQSNLHAEQVNQIAAHEFADAILRQYEALPPRGTPVIIPPRAEAAEPELPARDESTAALEPPARDESTAELEPPARDEPTAEELYQKALACTDITEFLRYCHAAANMAYVPAQCRLGAYYADKNDGESVKWYRRAAEDHHDAEAQYQLGQCYLHSKGVPHNDAEIVKWHKAAARQNHAKAQFALGGFYERGDYGVRKNRAKAFELYEQAAHHGTADMQFTLARFYAKRRAYIKAARWYKRAAELGHAQAALALEQLTSGRLTRWILHSCKGWQQEPMVSRGLSRHGSV